MGVKHAFADFTPSVRRQEREYRFPRTDLPQLVSRKYRQYDFAILATLWKATDAVPSKTETSRSPHVPSMESFGTLVLCSGMIGSGIPKSLLPTSATYEDYHGQLFATSGNTRFHY